MSKTRHLVYVAHLRGIEGISGKARLQQKLGNITQDEQDHIRTWEDLTKQVPKNIYTEYSASELAVYLGIKTGYTCPLTPISSTFGTKDGVQALIAFYIMEGYNVYHPKPVFTSEQEELIAYDSGPVVVNAGPGTGKTTVGVERAFRKQHEGVILVSYSNESVREIYRRFKEYPNHRGKIGYKNIKKHGSNEMYPIVVTTLDSLAWNLSGKGSIEESDSSHSMAVKDAISAIAHGRVPPHRHLIVDESQDIDEARGEMVKLLYATGKFKSMLILGDPRQRISKSGIWYTNLWVKGEYEATVYEKDVSTMTINRGALITLSDPPSGDKQDTPSSPDDFLPPFMAIKLPEPPSKSPDETDGNMDMMNLLDDLNDMDDLDDEVEIKLTDKPQKAEGYKPIDKTISVGRVGLSVSHRFKNQKLIELHNDLSSKRQDIHVELHPPAQIPDYGKFKCYNVGNYHDELGMAGFANYIKTSYIDSKFCTLKDICIIMPSITSENATSKRGQRMCAIFKSQGLNCYTKKEGSYLPNGIFVTTIQSVKGKEFSVVILYCMSEFPKFYPQIPHDQADSLIYVANTRAKLEIIYLSNETFCPPRGVDPNFMQSVQGTEIGVKSTHEINLKARSFGITESIGSHGWSRLLTINNYKVQDEEYYEVPALPDFNMGNARIKGVFSGMFVETLVRGKHLDVFLKLKNGEHFTMDNRTYLEAIRQGNVCNGFWVFPDSRHRHIVIRSDGINTILPEEIETIKGYLDKDLLSLGWKEWTLLTQVYDFICGDHVNSRYDIEEPKGDFPLEGFKNIAKTLIGAFGPGEPEVIVQSSWLIGACDLLFRDAIVELKCTKTITPEHRQQVMVYNACLPKPKTPYVYNMAAGRLEKIGSPQHVLLWRYIIDAYSTIRNHADIVVQRKNNLVADGVELPKIPQNLYAADTEFESGGVFDFAMVCLSDPYSSIVQPLYNLSKFAVHWIAKHHAFWKPEDLSILFKVARKGSQLDECFYRLGHLKESIVMYYKAKEDVLYPKIFGMKDFELSPAINRAAARHGSSSEPIVSVRLGELYDLLVEPMQFQKHLHQHSALTDALALYELYHLGHLR